MSQEIYPPPYQAPVTDKTGMVTSQWSRWFQFAFIRMGGQNALSNLELQATSNVNIAPLQAAVTILQAQVAVLQGVSDFNQGRDL